MQLFQSQLVHVMLASGAILGALTTYIYVATGIAYRHRDNGLAYILFVLGTGVWNGVFVAQFLSPDPVISQFFLSLSMVGSLLAGLGWFLFASTASSTPTVPAQRAIYGTLSILVGIGITLLVTAPVHTLYWSIGATSPAMLLPIAPNIGYWLHTGLLASLFGAGGLLFAVAWDRGEGVPYTRRYTIAGTGVVVALLGSNIQAPGSLTVAPLVSVCLTTLGWLQAKRWSGPYVPRDWESLIY